MTRTNHYEWLAKDVDGATGYAAKFEEADATAIDVLEKEARRRAVGGTEEPVYYQGVEVGTVRRYSDTLLIFLMKGNNPEKYRDRLTMDGGLNLNHSGGLEIVETVVVTQEDIVTVGGRLAALQNGKGNGRPQSS